MVREVDLLSYLPPFMAELKEIRVLLEAENPEFRLVWQATERVLANEFILTADEYGISRYEHMMGLLPSNGQTLEERRQQVLLKNQDALPYTLRQLEEMLKGLCGEKGYTIRLAAETYFVNVLVRGTADSGRDTLLSVIEKFLQEWLPCNMNYALAMFESHAVEITEYYALPAAAVKTYHVEVI